MPQSHPTTDPVRFLPPVRFLARNLRPSEAPVGILRRCCSRGHIRLRPRTAWHVCILKVWLNNSQDCTGTPCGRRTGPARESSMFFISYGTRTGPVRDPQGCRTAPLWTRKIIVTAMIGNNPAWASYLAVRDPYGTRTGCSRAVCNL